jgi:hypothetical protein
MSLHAIFESVQTLANVALVFYIFRNNAHLKAIEASFAVSAERVAKAAEASVEAELKKL